MRRPFHASIPALVSCLLAAGISTAAASSAAIPSAADAARPAAAGGPSLPKLAEKQVEAFKADYSKAGKALQAGKPARAVHLYERAARIHDANEGLYYNLACAHAVQNQTAAALAALEKALAAGWTDAVWPAEDSDLESLRDTLAFESWLERVEQSGRGGDWPSVESGSVASDEESLQGQVDEWNEAIRRLRGVMGNAAMARANRQVAAWAAASWDRIAASSPEPEERARAGREAIEVISGSDATRLSSAAATEVVRRAEAWLDEFLGAPSADSVRLTHAEASFASRTRSEDEAVREEAKALFEQDLLLIAATTPPGPALESSLVRLIGFAGKDLDRASLLYRKLIESSEDAEAARKKMRAGYATRGIAYKIEGLPDFTMSSTSGATLSARDLPGRVTLLDFWATWCGPCLAELPHLKTAYERYHEAGFDIVGISLDSEKDKNEQAFLAWCEENGMPWPQVYDGKGWEAEMAEHFGVRSIPFALLVDDEGRVLAADDELRGERLAESIAEALGPGLPGLGGQ